MTTIGNARREMWEVAARPIVALLMVLATFFCSACFVAIQYTIDHRFETLVERSPSPRETIVITQEGSADLIARDDIANFSFAVEPGAVTLSVRNERPEGLLLELENAVYYDAHGEGHKLFVSTPDVDPGASAEIAPASTLELFLWPEDWVRDLPSGPGVWKADSPLGGLVVHGSRARARAARESDIGRSVEIVLPVAVAGERYVYRFRFTATELRTKRITWA